MAALIIVLIAVPLAYFLAWRRPRLLRAVNIVTEVPYAVPGVVLAIAAILMFLKPLPVLGLSLYNTIWIILFCYLARFLVLGLRPVMSGYHQLDRTLEEAAQIVGARLVRRLLTIILPLVAPAAAAGALLVFLTAFNELTVSALLWSTGSETLGVVFFSFQQGGDSNYAAALGVLTVIVSVTLMLSTLLLGGRLPRECCRGATDARAPRQIVRRRQGARRRVARGRRRGIRRRPRALGLRQDHVAAADRGVRSAGRRAHPDRRHRRLHARTADPAGEAPFGIVFQSYALWPHMTVAENVAYGLTVAGVRDPERAKRVGGALALVELEGFAGRRPALLSGGQRQRVALARCLVTEPSLVLLDEPLANLDVHLRAAMEREFADFHERTGTTMIYITHDQTEAMALADRIAVMVEGRVLQFATPSQLYREPADATVARFIGDGIIVPVRVLAVDGDAMCDAEVFGYRVRMRCRQAQKPGRRPHACGLRRSRSSRRGARVACAGDRHELSGRAFSRRRDASTRMPQMPLHLTVPEPPRRARRGHRSRHR